MSMELARARKRQVFIFLLMCLGMASVLGKLYYWQVLQADRLSRLANAEHTQSLVVSAPRGRIYDAQGHLLVTNVVRDDVYVEPIQFATEHSDVESFRSDLAKWIQAFRQALPEISEDKLTKVFNSNTATVRVASLIEPGQSAKLRQLSLPYTFLEPHTRRVYPASNLAAQVLGYVQEGKGGIYGIERQYDSLLAGKPGSLTAETDLNGNPLPVGPSIKQPAVSGADLTLTIDSTIQYQVQTILADTVKKMEAQSGTVVVVNAKTGAILAMAGEPTFDPNNYGDYYNKLGCLGTQSVYFNPALYCAYEPGSTMKSVTMAAALDQHLITSDTAIQDPGYLAFTDGTPTVTNWEHRAYGKETMTQVLEHSANVGAAYVAHNILGPNRYYPYLERFGFGQVTGLAGPEQAGSYNKPHSPGWTPSDLARQSFGQSLLATPIQMAMAYQAIANGGVMMKPYLVSSITNADVKKNIQPEVERRVISSEAAKVLTNMLTAAASANQQATFPGYSIAVKTGTATTQGLAQDQTEASMAGFLPASDPQFVILVKIDRPQASIFGGTAAAPVWRSIAQQLVWRYNIPPDQPLGT